MEKILQELGITMEDYLNSLESVDVENITNDKLQMMEDTIFLAGTVW
jgi:hypothetical protein